jgi:hypothetical protein
MNPISKPNVKSKPETITSSSTPRTDEHIVIQMDDFHIEEPPCHLSHEENWADLENQFEMEYENQSSLFQEDQDAMMVMVGYDSIHAEMAHYNLNYTVKQLHQIMDYYGLKTAHLKKQDCIAHIALFESEEENACIVQRRRQLWAMLYELKVDPYTRRFIIGI